MTGWVEFLSYLWFNYFNKKQINSSFVTYTFTFLSYSLLLSSKTENMPKVYMVETVSPYLLLTSNPSRVWKFLMWFFMLFACLKVARQITHSYGFSSVWDLLWILNLEQKLKGGPVAVFIVWIVKLGRWKDLLKCLTYNISKIEGEAPTIKLLLTHVAKIPESRHPPLPFFPFRELS